MRTYSPRFLLFITTLLPLVLAGCAVSNKDFVDNERPQTKPQVIEGASYMPDEPNYADARELKLKVRELAEQLVANMQDCYLAGTVALPTSFVNLNDFKESSDFGRLIGEQLFFELNQRGYPLREYRMSGSIKPKARAGEFALSRELGTFSAKSAGGVVIVGTYSESNNAVFVNARLVRPRDGRVLRTANMVIETTPTVKRMLAAKSWGSSSLASGGMRIRDFDEANNPPPPQNQTAFERGYDIH